MALKWFIIQRQSKDEIIEYIDDIGINYYLLMNDPQNIAENINKKIDKKSKFYQRRNKKSKPLTR